MQNLTPKPPKSSTDDLIQLTSQTIAIMDCATDEDREFALAADLFELHTFLDYLKKSANIQLSESQISDLQTEMLSFLSEILKWKLQYAVPRPYVVAYKYSLPMDHIHTYSVSGNGPSYPSGHAAISRFLANKLSATQSLSDTQRALVYDLANQIAISRVHLGVHTLQDIREGIRLADQWVSPPTSEIN